MRESNPHVRVIVIMSSLYPYALSRYSPTSFRPITARICLLGYSSLPPIWAPRQPPLAGATGLAGLVS